jgi:hypothetical protein
MQHLETLDGVAVVMDVLITYAVSGDDKSFILKFCFWVDSGFDWVELIVAMVTTTFKGVLG